MAQSVFIPKVFKMAKINARLLMALRQLTDLPLSDCRVALDEFGGDFAAVVQHFRHSPCCGRVHASDAEVAAVLASFGLPPMGDGTRVEQSVAPDAGHT